MTPTPEDRKRLADFAATWTCEECGPGVVCEDLGNEEVLWLIARLREAWEEPKELWACSRPDCGYFRAQAHE